MPRPSQCPECGCYEACLYPDATHCAEREEDTHQASGSNYCPDSSLLNWGLAHIDSAYTIDSLRFFTDHRGERHYW